MDAQFNARQRIRLAQVIREHWHIVLFCLLLSAAIAQIVLSLVHPEFKAKASVTPEQQWQGGEQAVPVIDVRTEVERIGSRPMLMKALSAIDGNARTHTSAGFLGLANKPVSVYRIQLTGEKTAFPTQTFRLRPIDASKFLVDRWSGDPAFEHAYAFGDELELGGVRFRIDTIGNREQTECTVQIQSDESWCDQLLSGKLEVSTGEEQSRVIRIEVVEETPQLASAVANAIAHAYMHLGEEQRESMTAHTGTRIDIQLGEVRSVLDSARDALKAYRGSHGIVQSEVQQKTELSALGELQWKHVQTGMQLNVLERVSDHIRTGRSVNIALADLDPQTEQVFRDQSTQLNAIIKERQSALSSNDAEGVASADERIRSVRGELQEQLGMHRRRLLFQQDELEASINRMQAGLESAPTLVMDEDELESRVALYEKLDDRLLEQRAETMVGLGSLFSTGSILEPAREPLVPFFPIPWLVWTVACISGVLASTLWIRNRIRNSNLIHAPEDLYQQGTIPVIGQVKELSRGESVYAAFTALSTRILMQSRNDKPLVITVTSTHPGEGKSFIAAQLARTLAAQEKRVVLIDANTVRPSQDTWFGLPNGEGLSDILTSRTKLDEVLRFTSVPRLELVTSGTVDHPIGHLTATRKAQDLVEELRGRYDAVIIDTPDVGEHTDAIPFMKWSDLNLYVIRAESNGDEPVANAEAVKEEYRISEMHYVLNAMRSKRNHTGLLDAPSVDPEASRKLIPQFANFFSF
ncbi:MAG: polysaccharide biosynthesis tyrosine autokinase [Bacteroidota bacterium]